MGCVSSKMITRSASFRDDWSRLSFRRKGDGLDEVILSKNGGGQLVALLCTANSVARSRLKEEKEGSPPPAHEPAGKNKEDYSSSSLEHTSSEETCTDKNQNYDIEDDQGSSAIEVIMTSDHSISPSRRFRTIEDFDAMLAVAARQSPGGPHSSVDDRGGGGDERPGSRRRAMAKELAALSVPSGSSSFEFSRAGSRLLLGGGGGGGGQVVASSPGSYVTPKFGNFVGATQRDEVGVAVFDLELIAHFEQAMEQLTMEEDCILQKIVEGLDQEFSEEEKLENRNFS